MPRSRCIPTIKEKVEVDFKGMTDISKEVEMSFFIAQHFEGNIAMTPITVFLKTIMRLA